MISYLLPTHDRPAELIRTLAELGRLSPRAHDRVGGAEVIVVDNASDPPAAPPRHLANGLPVRAIRVGTNMGAAARTLGAAGAVGTWLVMLDDDSAPRDAGHVTALAEAPKDVAAVGADIRLPDGTREAGGLPEVFVGCGAAIRRSAFLDAGGYDPAFGYYVEEYDLCARLLAEGWRVIHDGRFRVEHRKTRTGRDLGVILRRLVRNSGWVVQRYAPARRREADLAAIVRRYARIARRERVEPGFRRGLEELAATVSDQPRRPLDPPLYDRFTGRAHVRRTLERSPAMTPGTHAALVDAGKGAEIVCEVLESMGVVVVPDTGAADVRVIATLSPGPMLDAAARWSDGPGPDAVLPWQPDATRDDARLRASADETRHARAAV
ncbi:MAG: glycosyltransferase family 2 protein [Planctomycetota bacterium]